MSENEVPASDEVTHEEAIRRASAEATEERKRLDEQDEEERMKRIRDEHNSRVQAAKAFDWDSWEKETGLTRPDIPDELRE